MWEIVTRAYGNATMVNTLLNEVRLCAKIMTLLYDIHIIERKNAG